MIKTFRGILEDGGQDKIWLSTKKGKVGYRIVKFEAMATTPGAAESVNVVKIYKNKQTSIDGNIDFSDGTLIGAIDFRQHAGTAYGVTSNQVIFDYEIFNQDIYVTHNDKETGTSINYYIELEVLNLSDNATLVSTLSDIRLNPQVGA